MTPHDLEPELLRHGASLQALASALLGRIADADDAVQQTWAVALERPPSARGPLGGWLHAVLRNVARRLHRDGARRSLREQRAARAEAVPSADEVATRQETTRALVDAVLALPEPYRSAIWHRFYEAKTPGAIAALTGEPLSTVKSRLQRGLALLRQRLDDRYGDRRAWLGALVPLVHVPSKMWGLGAAAAAGVSLMQGKHLVVSAIVVLLLAGGSVFVWSGGTTPPPMPRLPSPLPGGDTSSRESQPANQVALIEPVVKREPAVSPTSDPGVRVSGQVRDQHGSSMAGVEVWLECKPRGLLIATSADDGSLAFKRRGVAGDWRVTVRGPCYLRSPEQITIGPEDKEVRLNVIVEHTDAPDTLSGTVTDEDGAPVPDLAIWTSHHPSDSGGTWRGYIESARTDAAGRFCIRRKNPDTDAVSLMPDPATPSPFEAIDWNERHAWGESDIRLRVRRGGRVDLLVVESGTGTPVQDYGVRCLREPSASGFELGREVMHSGHHEAGRLLIDDAKAGGGGVVVYPADCAFAPSTMVRFEVDPRRTVAVRVEVHRLVDLPVEVVTGAQVPLAGARVQLLRWEGHGPLTLATPAKTTAEAWSTFSSSGGLALILDSAVTDPHGRATLRGPPGGTLAIKVLGPGCTPTLVERVVLQPDMPPLRIEVAAGASLRGRIVPASLLAKLAAAAGDAPQSLRGSPGLCLQVGGTPAREMPDGDRAGFPIGLDGRFAIAGVPPGDVTVVLAWFRWTGHGGTHEHRVLQTVRALRDGEAREVELDASQLLPVMLRGRVTVNGAPLARTGVVLYRSLLSSSGEREHIGGLGGFTTDDEGCFEGEIMPCDVRINIRLDGERQLFGEEWVTLAPGIDRTVAFTVARRRCTVRVLEADGARPAAGRQFFVQSEEWNGVPLLTADRDGVVIVDPAPTRFHLFALAPGITREQRAKLLGDPKRLAEVEVHLEPIRLRTEQIEARVEQKLPIGK